MTDWPLAELPAWDRLLVPEGMTLTVEPLRRVALDELLIVDDDLPQLDNVDRPRIERPDPNLARLLGIDPGAPPPSVSVVGHPRTLEQPPRHLACICRLTSSEQVYRAIDGGWRTVDELKRATSVAFGQCQGRRCVAGIAHRVDLTPDQPRGNITPRPPLVPVPASVLAAFGES